MARPKVMMAGDFFFPFKGLFGFLYGQTSPHNTHVKWKTMRSNIQSQTKEAVKMRPRWHGGNHAAERITLKKRVRVNLKMPSGVSVKRTGSQADM